VAGRQAPRHSSGDRDGRCPDGEGDGARDG
jgi:hypothetical protein